MVVIINLNIMNSIGYCILKNTRNKICLSQRLFTSSKGEIVTLDNQTMYFEKVGTGKHNLFFIPGALASSSITFSNQLNKLNLEKFTIVAWDPPGYGKSRPPERQFPPDFFYQDAKAAVALLKHLDIPKTNVIGWSCGGVVALIMAAQNPDLVEKLVLAGSGAYVSDKDMQIYNAARDINILSEGIKKEMIALYGEVYFRKLWNEFADAINNIYKKNQGDLCIKELERIKCPTLLIHGKKNHMVHHHHSIFLKERILNSKHIEWEDGKHELHVEHPKRFNEAIEKFILLGSNSEQLF